MSLQVTTQFDLQEGVLDTMARQARRSMRSLSASSCSSLSSLEATLTPVCSAASPMPASSVNGFHLGPFTDPRHSLHTESPQGEVELGARKRRRKRRADVEENRRAKRQRANPRKRARPNGTGARIAKSMLGQASCQPIQTDLPFGALRRSRSDGRSLVPDVEALRRGKFSVFSWDGM